MRFIWLAKGGKYSSFDKYRQFLPIDHPFRRDIKNFTKGVVVDEPPPQMMSGVAVREWLQSLRVKEGGGFVGYGEEHAWTQKSGLWRLPYMDDLLLPHNIDMMHSEKILLRHSGVQSWTFLIKQRTMLRPEWIKLVYAIDQN